MISARELRLILALEQSVAALREVDQATDRQWRSEALGAENLIDNAIKTADASLSEYGTSERVAAEMREGSATFVHRPA